MKQQELLGILKANQALETQEEIDQFLEAVYQLDPNDDSLLPDLFFLYHDGDMPDGPYEELDSVIAQMDPSVVAIHLAKVTPELRAKAKDYLDLFYIMTVVDTQPREVLIDALRKQSDEERRFILGLLDEIALTYRKDDDLEIRDGIQIVKSSM
jgi:hypothetical protein